MVERTSVIDFKRIGIEVAAIFVSQLVGAVSQKVLRTVAWVVLVVSFGFLIRDLWPSWKAWWWGLTGRSVSWEWDGSKLRVRAE